MLHPSNQHMSDNKLNEKQALAVELAVRGISDVEIAKKIGVSRQIINSWRNHDAGFMYALATRRQALREKQQDRLNALVDKSIRIVELALEKGDEKTQLQTAMFVLRLTGGQGGQGASQRVSRVEMEKEMVERTLIEVVREMGWEE
jgi:hypothetical protein